MNATLARVLKQPTTVTGLAVLAGAIAGAGTYLATRSLIEAQGIGGAVVGMVLVALPDNSADRSSIERLVNDVIVSVATHRLAPAIIDDVKAVLAAPVATVTTTTTTATPAA